MFFQSLIGSFFVLGVCTDDSPVDGGLQHFLDAMAVSHGFDDEVGGRVCGCRIDSVRVDTNFERLDFWF